MRLLSLAAFGASIAFAAVPALAQNPAHNNTTGMSGQSQSSQQNSQMEQKDLVQGLEKAGFTHVQVEPEVFVVHARNSEGQPVLMRIGPDSMEAVTAMGPMHTGSGANDSSTTGSGNSSSGQQHASVTHNGTTTQ